MIRVLSLFSGIGAFEKALERLGVEHEVVNYCEIDPYAGKAYSLIHGIPQEKNLIDVTKVDTSKLENIELLTYGFPCTDISIVGKMKGFEDEDGNTTRSGLFFEALRIIQDTKPKYAIAENVKNLMSKSFEKELDIVLNSLGAAGYNNYIKVLNAKDYGIPQNRERVFIVSIRRDVDDFSFDFPKKETLELRMKDLLEKNVEKKYYLSNSLTEFFIKNSFKNEENGNGFRFEPHVEKNAISAKTITTRSGCRMDDNFIIDIESQSDKFIFDSTNSEAVIADKTIEPIRIGNIYGEDKGTGYAGNVWDKDAIAPTLMTMQGGNRQPMSIDDIYASREPRIYDKYAPTIRSSKCGELKVAEPVIHKVDDKLEISYPDEPFVVASRGRYGEDGKVEQHLEPNLDGVSNTLTTVQKDNCVCEPINNEVKPKLVGGLGDKKLGNQYRQGDRIYDSNAIAMCLTAQPVGNAGGNSYLYAVEEPKFRIRKLTPKECFRLMGFDDKDIDILIENGISNTQLYKMARNSIVVDVLERLFECLLLKKKEERDLFSMMFEM